MITGFQATLSVDDGGTGGAIGSTSTKFSGLTTFSIPSLEAGKFDATELDQLDGSSAVDPFEREEPTGLIKVGPTMCELKYTKANYTRLRTLLSKRGYTFVAVSPDDLSSGSPVKTTLTFTGFISKVDAVKFEKNNPVAIPFEITVQNKPVYT